MEKIITTKGKFDETDDDDDWRINKGRLMGVVLVLLLLVVLLVVLVVVVDDNVVDDDEVHLCDSFPLPLLRRIETSLSSSCLGDCNIADRVIIIILSIL